MQVGILVMRLLSVMLIHGIAASTVSSSDKLPVCGVSSVYCMLQQMGREVSVAEVEAQFMELRPDIDLSEVSFKDLRNVLARFGVSAVSVQSVPKQLSELPTPAILHLNAEALNRTGHYVVLRQVRGVTADVVDLTRFPQRREIDVDILASVWTGYAIVVDAHGTAKMLGLVRWSGPLSTCVLAVLLIAFVFPEALSLAAFIIAGSSSLRFGILTMSRPNAISAEGTMSICSKMACCRSTSSIANRALAPIVIFALMSCNRVNDLPVPVDAAPVSRRELAPHNPSVQSDSPLTFEQMEIDVGMVQGRNDVQIPFTFRVWNEGPVKIRTARSSCCGGGGISPDIEGKTLSPGSTHTIYLTLRGAKGIPDEITADIVTGKPQKTYSLVLRGVLVGAPRCTPAHVVVETVPGIPPEARVQFSWIRGAEIEQLAIDEVRSELGAFTLTDIETNSTETSSDAQFDAVFADLITGTLRSTVQLPYGEHQYQLRIRWRNEAADVILPVTVHVRHPLRPLLSHVFCGMCKPSERLEKRVRFLRHKSAQEMKIKEITSTSPMIKGKMIDAETIGVTVDAPANAGRFDSTLTVLYDDPSVPSTEVHISGIVQQR